jgi:glycine oxidase
VSSETFDTIILGGGVIGCAIAYELSKNGQKVALVERRTIASGASGVSAAMLEAQLDSYRGEPFLSLALPGRALFPALWEELKDLTGIDFQYELCGILRLAGSAEEREELLKRRDFQRGRGLAVDWLEPEELKRSLPQIQGTFFGGLLHTGDGQVNASRFTRALAEGARRRGTHIFEMTETTGFLREAGGVAGIVCSTGTFQAQYTVIASGPWTPELGKLLPLDIPVEPLRGQLVVFETPEPLLPYPVFLGSRYFVPKKDGLSLAGTTTEKAGFDEKTTQEGVESIVREVTAFLPAIKSRKIRRSVAGLRPHTPDELPILGEVAEAPGLLLATGHYRNGILLAPITAKILSSIILKTPTPPVSPQSFSLARFQKIAAR